MPEKHGWMENEEIPTPSHEFQSMYRRFTDSLLPHAHGLKIVMVPSVRDKISDPILPLNPLPQVNQKCSHSIIMASNPDVLYIGSENDPMIIAISSDDIYLPIGLVAFDDPFPSSASKALKTQSESHGNIESLQIDGDNFNQKISGKNLIKNRFEKLATSIISQESLNPLEPSPTPIDYSVSPEKIHYGAAILKTIIERGGQGGSIASFGDDQKDKTYRFSNVAPHIVITSGTLSPFAFETDSKSLFVNSSHIMRSKTSHIESWVTIEVCSDNGNVRSSARVYQSSI